MLTQLSGHCHEVLTGVAFAWQGRLWTAVETTKVFFAALAPSVIDAYIATGEPLDKAGAYGIQGRAAAFIKYIEGSYSNVVGLPLYRTVALAKEAGVDLYDNHGTRSS
jgi:septum formation protein